jgi:hypothetical protein
MNRLVELSLLSALIAAQLTWTAALVATVVWAAT